MTVEELKSAVGSNADFDALKIDWGVILPRLKSRWNRLTDGDLDTIDGSLDVLVDKLATRYGFDRLRASREVDTFLRGFVPE